MNIFVTDPNPYKCAIALDDKRVGKMLIESVQMVATVMRIQGYPESALPKRKDGEPYRPAFPHHPCTKWVSHFPDHKYWLIDHIVWLQHEYTRRFGKIHAAGRDWADWPLSTSDGAPWPAYFCDCSGITINGRTNLFERYQQCLCLKWQHDKRKPTWTNREPPEWR